MKKPKDSILLTALYARRENMLSQIHEVEAEIRSLGGGSPKTRRLDGDVRARVRGALLAGKRMSWQIVALLPDMRPRQAHEALQTLRRGGYVSGHGDHGTRVYALTEKGRAAKCVPPSKETIAAAATATRPTRNRSPGQTKIRSQILTALAKGPMVCDEILALFPDAVEGSVASALSRAKAAGQVVATGRVGHLVYSLPKKAKKGGAR